MNFEFFFVCVLTLCAAKVYYIQRGDDIQYIDPTKNAPSGRLVPFYIRSSGSYTNASIAADHSFTIDGVASCSQGVSLESSSMIYLSKCEVISSTSSSTCNGACYVPQEKKNAIIKVNDGSKYTFDIVHVCDYDMIHDSVTEENSNKVVRKDSSSSFILGRTDLATCNVKSSEVIFSSGTTEISVATRKSSTDQSVSPKITQEAGEYDYFTRYTINSVVKGDYTISSPKHRICVYSQIEEPKPFTVYKMEQTRSEKRALGSEPYADGLLTWHTTGTDLYEYILPTDSVVEGEVLTPTSRCRSFNVLADAVLSTEGTTCKARSTCEIYNNGETTEWKYSQSLVIDKHRIEKDTTHRFYSVQLKFGEVTALSSEYYFNTDTNETLSFADFNELSDDEKQVYKQMRSIKIKADTWTGEYNKEKVRETYSISGHCFKSDGKTPISGVQDIEEDRQIKAVCHIVPGMSITISLLRGDNGELIAKKDFTSQSLSTSFRFPRITSGKSNIVDNPNSTDESGKPLTDRLKTIRLRWDVGGTFAQRTDDGEPTFSTVVVYRITRADGTVITNSSNDDISELLGPESENKDPDYANYRSELENLLKDNYAYSVVPYQTKNFIFQDPQLPLFHSDKLEVKLFGKYADVSDEQKEEKNIRFKNSYEFDIIDVCLPTFPMCSGLKVSPNICLANCDAKAMSSNVTFLFYRPETQIDIFFSNIEQIKTCDDNYMIDLCVDGTYYKLKFQENATAYHLNVTLMLDDVSRRRKVRDAYHETKELPSGQYAVQLGDDFQNLPRADTQVEKSTVKIVSNGTELFVIDSRIEITGYANQYKYGLLDRMPTIYKCYIPIPSRPSLKTAKQYSFPGKDITIGFHQSQELYNECITSESKNFTGYFLKYWPADQSEDEAKNLTSIIPATSDLNENMEFTVPSDDVEAGVYDYRIVAFNFLNETGSSIVGTFQVCTSTLKAELSGLKPKLVSPKSEFPATIQDLTFTWETPMKLQALRCSASEQHKIILTVSKIVKSQNGARRGLEEVLTRELPPSTQSYRLSSVLLDLSSDYTWKVTVAHTNETGEQSKYESDEIKFTTVEKHCSRMKCVHGVCDQKTLKCNCFEGYRGETCSGSVAQIGAIVGAIFGLIAIIAVVAILAFLGIRQGMKYKLGKPKFKRYRLILPESIDTMGAVPSSSQVIEEKLATDPMNKFEWAIAMLTTAKGDDVTELCRALVYAFERHGHGLDLLLRLVDYEIEKAQFVNTLFRNNSFATKCFYVYSHLIGLDYLYELTAPLLQKLLKDQERNNMQVAVIHQHSRFEDVDFDEQHQVGYEINPALMDEVQSEDYIYTNALSVQLSCQVFISTLMRSNIDCPYEFIRLCNYIKQRFKEKFPDSNSDHALSAFMFLRFIIAGLSTPKECGFISVHPRDEMRRQLILISKVLSMWSIGATFDEKEEYMVVMNDFIEGHANALAKYYEFVTSESVKNRKIIPAEIPDKYYDASIEVLGSMDGLINRNNNTKKHKKAKKERSKKDATEQESNAKHHHHHHHHHHGAEEEKKEQIHETETASSRKKAKDAKKANDSTSEVLQSTEGDKEDRQADDKSENDASSGNEQNDAQESETVQRTEAEQAAPAESHSSHDETENVNESQQQQDESQSQDADDITENSDDVEDSDEVVQQSNDDSDTPSTNQDNLVDDTEDITQSDDTE